MDSTIPQAEWRCRKCGGVLGVERDGRIHFRLKQAQYMARGEVMAVCPLCSELNQTRTPEPVSGASHAS